MRVHKVESLLRHEFLELPSETRRRSHTHAGQSNGSNAVDRNAVHHVITRCRGDDARIESARAQHKRQVPQVQLDAAEPRQEPVADERDLQECTRLLKQAKTDLRLIVPPLAAKKIRIPDVLSAAARREGKEVGQPGDHLAGKHVA